MPKKPQSQLRSKAAINKTNHPCLWPWFGVGWGMWVILKFIQRFPVNLNLFVNFQLWPLLPTLVAFLQYARAAFLFAGTVLGWQAAACLILRYVPILWNSSLEKLVFISGLGFTLLAYMMFALGIFAMYKPVIFWGLFAIGLILSFALWKSELKILYAGCGAELKSFLSNGTRLLPLKILIALTIAISFGMSFVPEIFYDSMVYHLGIPRFYLLEGRMQSMPFIHEKFPFAMQMQNLWGLALEGEILAKLIHWSSLVLIFLAFVSMSQRYATPVGAIIAAIAFITMPMAIMQSWTAGVDVRLSCVALLCGYAWLNFISKSFDMPWLILAAIFGGMASASKNTAALLPFSLGLSLFGLRCFREKKMSRAFRDVAIYLGIVFIMVLPWLVKNYIELKNPFFPFFTSIFGTGDVEPGRLVRVWGENVRLKPHNLKDLLLWPWNITFMEISSLSAPGLFPLIFLPWLVWYMFGKERDSWYRPYLLGVGMSLIMLFIFSQITRLAMPMLSNLSFLIGWCAGILYKQGSKLFRAALAAVCFFAGAVGLLNALPVLFQSYDPWKVLTGTESRLEYQSYTHPGMTPYPSTRLYDYIEKNISDRGRVLIVGDEKISTCKVPFRATGVFNRNLLSVWTSEAGSEKELSERFQKEGVSHILLNLNEAYRLLGYDLFGWKEDELARFCQFWDAYVSLERHEKVKEKYFDSYIDLYLYTVKSVPGDVSRAQYLSNPILYLYEEQQVSHSTPDFIRQRVQMYEKLLKKWPNVTAFQIRRFELLSAVQNQGGSN